MINFKVDVGYYNAANNNDHPSNLSQCHLLAFDRYMSIITNYDGSFPNSTKTIETFQTDCQTHFGDDWLSIWCVPTRERTDNMDPAVQWCPSLKYMYPNTWAFRYSSEYQSVTRYIPIVYFRKLGKLVEGAGASSGARLYNVGSDGTLTYVNQYGGAYFAVGQSIEYPILPDGYTPGSTDLSAVQFARLSATTNSTGGRPSSVQMDAAGRGILNAIFADNPDPDIIPPENTDPYAPAGSSDVGGGTGTFSETGDTIGIPGLPTLSAVDTGFITLFNPSAAQVKALANYMWSSSFDLATFKNIVANPIDCILGLTIVPVDPPNAGSKVVSVGNIPTDVTLPYLSSQYVEVDCGTLNVQEFWGSYLDYSPYTKMSLYLPYIGIIPLDIDDVMNASIAVKYHVDVLSGACVAYVLCNGTQLYTYVGQCSSNVPITSNDFTNTVNGILGIAGSIGKLAADGGASAPTEAAGIAANAINALKPNIQKSGAMSGTGGLMGVQTPYLICQRPRQSVPANQNSYTGYPANITARLSDLSGYTEVESIHLDGLSATQEEQQEIMDLLTSGVII